MAGVKAHAPSGEVSLSAGVAKTVLQIVAAANHRTIVKMFQVFGKGVLSTDTPMRVRVLRQTTAGTMSAGTVTKNDDSDSETLQTTSQTNASAEPTAGDVLDIFEVHPQTGLIYIFPPGDEIQVRGGQRLGFEVLAAQAQTVTVKASVEE